MKELYKNYLDNKIKLDKWTLLAVLSLVIVISGVFGFIYEFIFYYFNSGMQTFYYRGSNFLPWINIYATGSIMIYLLTRKFKRKPLLVFIIAFFSTGILEYFSGLAMYKLMDGIRCWNYNTEIFNFGNINGFVCLRSVTFFGISGLLLMYLIIPFILYLSQKINKKVFIRVSIALGIIFLFDELYNLIFAHLLSLPRARDIYTKIGFKYMDYYK